MLISCQLLEQNGPVLENFKPMEIDELRQTLIDYGLVGDGTPCGVFDFAFADEMELGETLSLFRNKVLKSTDIGVDGDNGKLNILRMERID